jgi:serine/threonine protein kinase
VTGIAGDPRPRTGAAEELRPQDPGEAGPYRLLGRLGSGGMGQVFLGRSPGGRLVAVKVIRAELADQAEFRHRFAREVAAARTVSGVFTAAVVDADVDAAVPWLATAYVPGPSLAGTVAGHGPLPAASVLALAAGLAEGLGAIHAAGIVHRDLKPSNVLLAEDGPRIIDFGISLAAEATVLTGTDVVLGSPAFMSPEQARGQRVGPPGDVFSLGAVLTFAAAGQGPFGSGSSAALMYRVAFAPPDTSGVPAGLRPLVERCLAKDPEQRPTTEQFLAGLGTALPAAGWLPEPVTRAFPPRLPPEPGPAEPTAAGDPRPGLPRPGLAGTVTAVALLIAYLVVAMTAHLPPFGRAPAAPSSPAPASTAPASAGTRPAPPASSPATLPVTSRPASPVTSPVSSPPASPVTSPVTSPPASPATSPPASPVTSPPASPVSSPPASPATAPATSPAIRPGTLS